MGDDLTPIEKLKEEVRNFVNERDWGKYHHPKELAISIAIEAAELLEVFQWDEKVDIRRIMRDEETMSRIKEEVADVMMYILCMSNQLHFDLSEAVMAKLRRNRTKYNKDVVRETGAYRKDKLLDDDGPSIDGKRRR